MQRKLTEAGTMPNSILKFKLQKNVSLLAVKNVRPADPAVIIMRFINSQHKLFLHWSRLVSSVEVWCFGEVLMRLFYYDLLPPPA